MWFIPELIGKCDGGIFEVCICDYYFVIIVFVLTCSELLCVLRVVLVFHFIFIFIMFNYVRPVNFLFFYYVQSHYIQLDLNVKKLTLSSEMTAFIALSASPNRKALGPRLKGQVCRRLWLKKERNNLKSTE